MIQELKLQGPDLGHDHFSVKKEGKEYQKWEKTIYDNDELEFFYEGTWLKGTVASWYIDDASGNAPGADAHFFLVVRRDGKTFQYDLHADRLIRIEAPTDEELIARSGWCECGDWEDRGPYMPADFIHCNQKGTLHIAPSGQYCWYCDKHLPIWLNIPTKEIPA